MTLSRRQGCCGLNLPVIGVWLPLAVGAGSGGCRAVVAWAAALGVELLAHASPALASGGLTPGDAALLRFAAAAEILETDFGSSTTSSGACRTARFLAGAAARHTRQPYRCWIRTWPSTS